MSCMPSVARGELTTPDGSIVDYDKTAIPDGENKYHYIPSDDLAFVDDQGLSDRNTILKGDEYIANVYRLRSRNGEVPPSSIDDVTNGVLLRKDLHAMLGYGEIAFIKTPNYELEPEHIKRFERGSPGDHITLQILKKPDNYDPIMLEANCRMGPVPPDRAFTCGANIDALFQGEGRSLLSTTILDYFYGIAAYKYWHSGVPTAIVEHRQNYHAQLAPALTYFPSSQEHKISRGDERCIGQVMDEANTTLMWYRGIKQREAAKRKEKDVKQEERDKVIEWRSHLEIS
ncbi:hypothetical protein F5148DRAFT_1151058 [Russula earlei]|uniref:Uncharacterized protein n=1 Tax=Russula earlei TaxID=71964 RepID=A0ACC0U1L9_9AGAM|nr:hypothetical protein F5148DRAFT_1151058 [Russula earlei]